MDSNVVGATGQNGTNGQTLGASGTSGDPGGDAGADASSATDTTNTAEATGGQGGSGGDGAANTPSQGGGRAGNGGDGGKAVATAAVTAATADGNKATATATGGTGGGGGVGGAPSALGGVGGNGGGAKATATATNTDGAATATATATGGTGGVSQYDTPGPYPGGYVGNVYASGNGANVAGSSATANGTTSATATVTQTGGYGASGPAGGNGGSSTLTDAVSGTTDDGTLSLMQTAVGGGGGEGGLYAGRGASGGDATSDLTVDDTSSKQVSADVVATGGDGGNGQLATGGAQTIGPGGTAEASGTITGTSTVGDTVSASGGDGDANGGTANATGTGTAGKLANVEVTAGGGEANGIGGAANAVATGSAADAIVTVYAVGGTGYQSGGSATAQATAIGQSGTATANAATNYDRTSGFEDSLEATSAAPVAGTSKAVAAMSQSDTLGAFDTTAQSVSTAVLDPSAVSNGTDFGTGDTLLLDIEQGGGNFTSVTGDVTVTSTLEGYLDLAANSSDSHLLLDLDNATLIGRGVTAVDISVQFSSQATYQTFTSGAAAEAYFSHDVIDLGALSDLAEFSSNLTRTLVDIQISVSVDAPLSGFYANGQVAIEPASAAAPDVFQETDAATAGPYSGDYVWSNAGNWVGDQPVAGSNVEMAGVGVDDIAGLSLASLSVSPPSGNGTEGKLSVVADLTVNTLTVAASSEIDIVGPAQLNVTGAATIDGTIVTDPSTLTVEGAITGTGTIDIGAGSSVIFNGAVAATETIDFIDTTGTLTIADPSQFAAQIVGSGTEIVICYVRGTRVATPAGEVPIETLARGDRLLTRFGGVRPIKWIGRQSFAAGFLARNREQWPVRIAAGALGDARPARDLYVSAGHSMLIADRLILARNLVNGVTITQTPPAEDVHYYQVEFEAHDCILAEGAWSESYADAEGLRNQFHNAGEFRVLFPDATSPAEPALCAPRPQSGPDLQAALAPVVARATAGLTPGPLHGWIEAIEPDGIVGWAQDTAYPELPVLLDIWLHDRLLGRALACDFRGDLEAAEIGRGYCSFRFCMDIPAGSARDLVVCRAADGAALPPTDDVRALVADRHDGEPEAPGPLQGWIDNVGPDRIDGWAHDAGHPGRPVRLEVWLRGTLLGTVVASAYRRDVEVAGIGRGYCGFSFRTLGGIAARHLTVCRAADGAVLPMTSDLLARAA